jgi:hypothetical protein
MSNQLFEALINKAGYDDVRGILENHQEAVEIKHHYGRLPLHIAFQFKATEEVIYLVYTLLQRRFEMH